MLIILWYYVSSTVSCVATVKITRKQHSLRQCRCRPTVVWYLFLFQITDATLCDTRPQKQSTEWGQSTFDISLPIRLAQIVDKLLFVEFALRVKWNIDSDRRWYIVVNELTRTVDLYLKREGTVRIVRTHRGKATDLYSLSALCVLNVWLREFKSEAISVFVKWRADRPNTHTGRGAV